MITDDKVEDANFEQKIKGKIMIGNMIFFLLLMRAPCKRKHLKVIGFHPPMVS